MIYKKLKFFLILILVFAYSIGIFQYPFLLLNKAEASNNYISDISFYKNDDDLAVVDFYVDTTFQITIGAKTQLDDEVSYCLVGNAESAKTYGNSYNGYATAFWPIGTDYDVSSYCGTTWTFTAGNTYTVLLGTTNAMRIRTTTDKICVLDNCPVAGDWDMISRKGEDLDSNNYISDLGYASYSDWWTLNDTEDYYFSEFPSLSLTYPEANEQEIAGDFQITGEITMPSPYTDYNYIAAAVYFQNPWSEDPIDFIGNFFTDLTATSTQEFEIDVLGLPVSYPDKIKVRMELWDMNNNIISNTYTGTGFPWYFDLYTRNIGEAPTYPEFYPIWEQYLDISHPAISTDGYYKINTPTSTVEFIHNFPETYKIYIEQEDEVKMATTTFSNINIGDTRKFEVDDIDASTSSVKWLEAIVYNPDEEEIIRASFPILGLEPGEFEAIASDGANWFQKAIQDALRTVFLPSPATLNKYTDNLPNLLKSKIPFSYWYEIKEAIEAIDTSPTATTTPLFEYNVGEFAFAFNPLDASDLTNSEGWQTLYNTMRMACWLLLVLYIIGRVRDRTTNTAD